MHLLPLELHILVQSFLEPRDIISLRMTSKLLYLSTQQRTVWLTALHRVCEDHALFEPSFPTKNMSTKELEYVALSPARVSARMKKGLNETKIAPWKDQPFRASLSENLNRVTLRVIPGGRYLLTGSIGVGVSLWDLGTNPTSEMPKVPMATTIVRNIGLIDTSPTSDGLGILVTTYFVDDGFSTHIIVYEIYPSAAQPQFCRKGELNLNGMNMIHSLTGYHFVSLDQNCMLTFWDIKSNKSFTWDAPFEIEELFLLENHLIILNRTDIMVWEIPFLKNIARSDISDNELANLFPPTINLGYSFPLDSRRPKLFTVPSQWWPKSYNDIILGSVAPDPKNSASEIALHGLDPRSLASGGQTIEMGTLSAIPLRMVDECEFLFRLRFCNGELCQRWRPETDVLISLIPIPTSHEETKSVVTRTLFSGPFYDFDFCPASGRLVVFTENGIRVMDFLSPMSVPFLEMS